MIGRNLLFPLLSSGRKFTTLEVPAKTHCLGISSALVPYGLSQSTQYSGLWEAARLDEGGNKVQTFIPVEGTQMEIPFES